MSLLESDILKGAIFDIDGTLLDSMGAWWDACRSFFTRYGLYFTDEQGVELKEMRLEDSLPMLIKRYGLSVTPAEAIDEIKKEVVNAYKTSIPLKPYAKEYLEKLKRGGVRTAVATSGYKELCQTAFKRLGVFELIDEYAFSQEVNKSKEHPDIYLLAAKRLGAEPNECTVYEDIVAGIKSAKQGGFSACAIYDPSNEGDTDVLKQCADHYITGWKALL